MRTTLDIEDDGLEAAKELARLEGTSADQMVSRLLRAALRGDPVPGLSTARAPAPPAVARFRPFQAPGGRVVTNDHIDQLRDEAGLRWPGLCWTSTW